MMNAPQSWLWNGSAFVPCNGIPAWDRGFRHGMALFESLAIRDRGVEFLEAHLTRLERACRQCGFPLDSATLSRAGEMFHLVPGPTFARIYVTAGAGAPTDPVTAPGIILFAEPRETPTARAVCVGVHPEPFLPVLGGLQTASYWANVAALQAARMGHCNEALLFNPRGELISACMANVFVELEGRWVTPPLASGARGGVVREWVMQRRETVERPLHREDLGRTGACFLTNCWVGVTPVATLDSRPLPTAFAEALRAEFFGGS